MFKHFFFPFLFTLALLPILQCEKPSPDMIVVLARHGAREPLNDYYDPSWQNPSYLMNTGIEQHYTLGNVLAREYEKLLEDIYPQEIYLQSTYTSRAQMSVSAELLGMFHERSHKHLPNTTKRDFLLPYADKALLNEVVDGLLKNSQMIPNRLQFLMKKTLSSREEDLLQVTPDSCSYIRQGQIQRTDDEVNKAMQETLKGATEQLKKLGYKIENIGQIKEFGDTLASRYSDNKPPLSGIAYDSQLYKDLVFGFQWWNIYNLLGSELEKSLRVFPLYSRLIEWFNGKANGSNPLKLVLLGAHESSMFPFLDLYNITNHTCFAENYKSQSAGKPIPFPDCKFPEVASQLIWEYYNNSGNPYIRLLYNGKPFKFCRNNKGLECSLSDFTSELPEAASNLTKEKFDEICVKSSTSESSKGDSILTMTMGFFGALVGLILYLFVTKRMVFAHKYVKGHSQEDVNGDIETPSASGIQIQSPKGKYAPQVDDASHAEEDG
jgi:hypothetical protein